MRQQEIRPCIIKKFDLTVAVIFDPAVATIFYPAIVMIFDHAVINKFDPAVVNDIRPPRQDSSTFVEPMTSPSAPTHFDPLGANASSAGKTA
jgi:hypothetical protein